MKGLLVFGALLAVVVAVSLLLLPKQYRPQFYVEREDKAPAENGIETES